MGRLNYDQAPALGVPTAANDDVSNQAASTAFVQNLVPPGVVFPYAGPIPPTGWLLADGSAVSRTVYARLFTAIGTTYGAGDGSTTFNLPELRGEFLRGLDNGRGVDAGRTLGSAQADAMQGHGHDLYGELNTAASGSNKSTVGTSGGSTQLASNSVRGPISDGVNGTPRIAAETRPANVAMNYIIKAQ